MPTPRLAIIADDLTGALDAAAPFSTASQGVAVATRPEALRLALASGAEVVSVSTRSREIDADAARERVAAALAALPPGTRVVKKIDSRLKGNLAAELEALEDRPLVVLPAIPEFGRLVRGGCLAGFGVDAPIAVRSALGRFAATAHVPDTATQRTMVHEVQAAPADAVLVGARGMAQALAEVMGLGPAPQLSSLPPPLCFAVGSTDPITLAQVSALRAAWPGLTYVQGPAGALPPPAAEVAAVTLLQATPGDVSAPDLVARTFARSAVRFLATARSMLLTGGATAEAILDALGIDMLRVVGEALPGVAYCRADQQIIVTKSGGFGAPDAFVRLARADHAVARET